VQDMCETSPAYDCIVINAPTLIQLQVLEVIRGENRTLLSIEVAGCNGGIARLEAGEEVYAYLQEDGYWWVQNPALRNKVNSEPTEEPVND
jgi:hypothetical protein